MLEFVFSPSGAYHHQHICLNCASIYTLVGSRSSLLSIHQILGLVSALSGAVRWHKSSVFKVSYHHKEQTWYKKECQNILGLFLTVSSSFAFPRELWQIGREELSDSSDLQAKLFDYIQEFKLKSMHMTENFLEKILLMFKDCLGWFFIVDVADTWEPCLP